MPNRAAPTRGDAVSMLVILGISVVVGLVVVVLLLDRALNAGDISAWAFLTIVLLAALTLGVVARTIWKDLNN